MSAYKTHVCLVSAQSAPNLLPLLDDALKPQKVILLATPEMKEKAAYLEQVIKPRGIQVQIEELDSMADFDAMQERLMQIIGNHEPDSIALNVTGGTKWMAIAAQEIFSLNQSPVFYVNMQDDRVLFLGKGQQSHALSQRIDLDNYLKAYGYQIIKQQVPQGMTKEHRELCESLVSKVVEWESALGQLNMLASYAANKKSRRVKFSEVNLRGIDQHLPSLMSELYNAKIIKNNEPFIIEFSDELALEFANGGWLEIYINSRMNELKADGTIQDSPKLNLEVKSPKGSKNEIDIAFMAKNHLHIIECKTKRMSGAVAGQAGTEALYKLDSISELGGLTTKSMLVSYRKLRDADRQRAKDLKIKVVEGQAIQQLKTILRDWISGSSR